MSKNSKFNKKMLFKTTSALTCLVGSILLFNQTGANAITSTGTMSVTATVGNVCSLTATELTFGTFPNTAAVHNSSGGGVVTTSCSGVISHVLSVTELSTAGVYTMAGTGSSAGGTITFKLYKATGAAEANQVSDTVEFATATGTGSAVAVATLFGQIQANNTGKPSGSYTKSVGLNAVYN